MNTYSCGALRSFSNREIVFPFRTAESEMILFVPVCTNINSYFALTAAKISIESTDCRFYDKTILAVNSPR
jgi:hypothetical protein